MKKRTTKNCDSSAPTPTGSDVPSTLNNSSGSSAHTEAPTSATEPARKKRKVDKSEETKDKTDEWLCSFCFGNYADDEGNDWIRCACSRWVHEKCAEDVIVDAEGLEKFCPFCTSLVG